MCVNNLLEVFTSKRNDRDLNARRLETLVQRYNHYATRSRRGSTTSGQRYLTRGRIAAAHGSQ